jgi:plastocyanin
MRKLLLLAAVAAGSAALVPAALGASAAKTVKVGDNYYVRPSGVPKVTVKKGAVVKWVFRGHRFHNVTVKRGPVKFHSSSKSSGSFSKKLTRRGTYTIFCSIHGAADQSMKLVVK